VHPYHYVWLLWSTAFLVPWAIPYWAFPDHRKAMLWASVLMAPFGLTEPLFVPEYWNPPSLFDSASGCSGPASTSTSIGAGRSPLMPGSRRTYMAPARFLLSTLLWASVAALAEPEIRVERREGAFRVDARMSVDAHHHIAWQVLTDYNNLARFVPGMQTSQIVSAPGEPMLLRQTGQSGFLVFNVPIEVIARIEEFPLDAIRFYAVGGNLKNKVGEWRIQRQNDATLLLYQADIVPGFWVPALLAASIMAEDVRRKLVGVAQEVQRRATRATSAYSGSEVVQRSTDQPRL
jgi:hypothetical protein